MSLDFSIFTRLVITCRGRTGPRHINELGNGHQPEAKGHGVLLHRSARRHVGPALRTWPGPLVAHGRGSHSVTMRTSLKHQAASYLATKRDVSTNGGRGWSCKAARAGTRFRSKCAAHACRSAGRVHTQPPHGPSSQGKRHFSRF